MLSRDFFGIAVITTTKIELLIFQFPARQFLTIVFFEVQVILVIYHVVIRMSINSISIRWSALIQHLIFFALLISLFKFVVVANERFRLFLG